MTSSLALVSRLRLLGLPGSNAGSAVKAGPVLLRAGTGGEYAVQAGDPTPALEEKTEALTIDGFLVEKPSETVLVKVKGDSMMDAGILDGSIVVVEKRDTANIGDVVVASYR